MADMQEVTIVQEPTGPEAPKPVSATQRPEDVPEQFWDAEKGEVNTAALLAAVKAQNEAPAETEEKPAEGTEEKPAEAQAEALAEEAGVDIKAVEAAFLETGEIPADTYERLSKVGVGKELVDEFVQLRIAQAERVRDDTLRPYGGLEAVGKMVEWAGKNWSEKQAEAFNAAVNSGDVGQMELAVKALKTDYDKQNGVRPSLVSSSTAAAGSDGGVFRSIQELTAAQRDPRYATDPAYRQSVLNKLARSSI